MNFDGEDKRWDEYYKREWNYKGKPLPKNAMDW